MASEERTRSKIKTVSDQLHETVGANVRARPDSSGTLLITLEINMSQGGIGQVFITEQFRAQVKA